MSKNRWHRENIIQEQKKINYSTKSSTPSWSLQNSSTQTEGDPENNGSQNLHTRDELIPRRIIETKLPQDLIPTTHIHYFPLSKDIQECKFLRKFSTPTIDSNFRARNSVQHIRHFRDKIDMEIDQGKIAHKSVILKSRVKVYVWLPRYFRYSIEAKGVESTRTRSDISFTGQFTCMLSVLQCLKA